MLKVKKFWKRNIYSIPIAILIIYIVFYHFSYNEDDYRDNKYKIALIEESIKSLVNYAECKIPDLPIDNPDIMKFYTSVEELDCGNRNDDWVICQKSECRVKDEVLKDKGQVTCSYTDLIRKSDYKVKYGKTTHTRSTYTLRQSDFAKVVCKAEDGERWFGLVIGIRDTIKPAISNSKEPFINILMLGFDSLSKNAFIRKLPQSYKYLTKELNALILQAYNIIGDGTPQALIPILTGHTELELPETRRRMRGSQYVDGYPMIWKDYKKFGYVTAFNEDLPESGIFTYRLNGFNEQPTDHYMRTFYLEVRNYLSSYPKFCIGHQRGHVVMLDYTKNLMLKYKSSPKFIFSFHGELSHDSINLIEMADLDLKNWLHDLKHSEVLNNTILILMSDHGNRFAEVRNTLQGKEEERLPFFSFIFPNWFEEKFRDEYQHFIDNLNTLTTPFDIHETLLDVLRFQSLYDSLPSQPRSRALSLFGHIPKNRSCADAYIEPHWCACLRWIKVNNTKSNIIIRAAKTIVDSINNYTGAQRNFCERLELKDINWAMKLAPHENLLKFKQNRDQDGFLADLSSNTKVDFEIYQIKIVVTPGYSIFEASITYNIISKKFVVNMDDVSRVNKYGSQANCIYEINPDLRKYCFCKVSN